MASRRRKDVARKPTATERLEREQVAVETLCAHAGARQYTMETALMAKLGISRRSAARYLARARARVRDEAREQLRDLGNALPDALRRAIDLAGEAGDLRSLTRLLTLVGELAPLDEEIGAPRSPLGRVEFIVVDPENGVCLEGGNRSERE